MHLRDPDPVMYHYLFFYSENKKEFVPKTGQIATQDLTHRRYSCTTLRFRVADLWHENIGNQLLLIGIHTNRVLICTTIAGFRSKAAGKHQSKRNKMPDPLG